MFLYWGMFAERVAPIFWKKEVEVVCNVLFIVNFVSINYEIWWELFLLLHLLSNSFMAVQVCFIFDTYLLNFDS